MILIAFDLLSKGWNCSMSKNAIQKIKSIPNIIQLNSREVTVHLENLVELYLK